MIDETEKKIRAGQEAEKLIENQILRGAITHIRNECYRDIENSAGNEKEVREDNYYLLKAITKFEKSLIKLVKDSKDLQAKIKNQNTIARMIRD